MSYGIPAGRIRLDEQAPKAYTAMYRLEQSIELDNGLRLLIKIRALQIIGCAFCIDVHWKDARAADESEERLYSLDAWRESSLYSQRERAALGLCEAITLVAAGHVPNGVWKRASAAFSKQELSNWCSRSPRSTHGTV